MSTALQHPYDRVALGALQADVSRQISIFAVSVAGKFHE